MNKGLKITLIGVSILGVSALGIFLYRNFTGKGKSQKSRLRIGNIDWVNKEVPYSYSNDGVTIDGQSVSRWSASKVKPNGGEVFKDSKNEIKTYYLPNGLIIASTALGNTQEAYIVDFFNKTVKPFSGDVAKTINDSYKTLNKIIF